MDWQKLSFRWKIINFDFSYKQRAIFCQRHRIWNPKQSSEIEKAFTKIVATIDRTTTRRKSENLLQKSRNEKNFSEKIAFCSFLPKTAKKNFLTKITKSHCSTGWSSSIELKNINSFGLTVRARHQNRNFGLSKIRKLNFLLLIPCKKFRPPNTWNIKENEPIVAFI